MKQFMPQKSFGDLGEGRANNFDFLRFFLATCVIFSHSFGVLYTGYWFSEDPLNHWTKSQTAFGGAAVDGFFLISGFLILKSWEGSKNLRDFAAKRTLRILPALITVLLVTVLIIGPLGTNLGISSYFHSPRTYAYFAFMGTINLHLRDRLPGVFVHNPLPWRVNGSLWTIRLEVICYILVAILGLLRVYRRPAMVLLASLAALGIMAGGAKHLVSMGEFADSLRVLTYFLWGMTFYLYRRTIPHSRVLLLLSLAGLFVSDLASLLAYTLPVLGAYLLFYTAFSPGLRLQKFAQRGDFSYGLYLYAFPVQQLLVSHFRPVWNAGTLTFATFLIANVCAVLSWHFVEKPFLKRKPKANLPNTDLMSHPVEASSLYNYHAT